MTRAAEYSPVAPPASEPRAAAEWVPTPAEIRLIVSGLVIAVFVSSLDQTILAGSLSSIASDLSGWSSASWLVSGYLIASIVATPVAGRLSDLFGRRKLLLILSLIYIGGSIACASAWSMPTLISTRILQGLGAGGLRAVAMSAVSDLVSPRERGRYQVYFSTAFGVSSLCGPTLGGFLSTSAGWRSIFWLSSVLGLAALALTYHQLRRLKVAPRRARIDWLGAALIAGFTFALVMGINEAHHFGGWRDNRAIGYLMTSLVLLGGLIWTSRTTAAPMFPVKLFARPVFASSCAVTLLSCMVMTGMTVTLPLIYAVFGYSAQIAGLLLIPVTFGVVAGSFIAGQAVLRTGNYRFCPVVGTLIGAIVCIIMSWNFDPASLTLGVGLSGVLGLSFGFQLAPLTVAVQNAADARDAGAAMSCLLFFRLLGGATGVALLTDAFISRLPTGTLNRLNSSAIATADTLSAVRSTTLIGAVIMLLAFIVSLGLKQIPLRDDRT